MIAPVVVCYARRSPFASGEAGPLVQALLNDLATHHVVKTPRCPDHTLACMTRPINELMPPSLREATGPVYHYTSAAGLLGLVGSRCLWASEATSLNDLAEVRHGWEVVKAWLAKQPSSEAADLLTEMAENPLEEKHEVFVLSASTAGDDANQWRLYGQSGNGYAVGLDAGVALAAISDAPEASPTITSASGRRTINLGWLLGESATVSPWYHVLYSEDQAAAALQELLEATARELPTLEAAADAEEFAELRDVLNGKALEALGTIAHLLKGPGFSGEREVRVVVTFLLADQHIRYRPGPNGIVSYGLLTRAGKSHPMTRVVHRSKKNSGKPLPILSVRLGPLLNEEHISTVKRLLVGNKLKSADVKVSTVKLR